VTALHAFEKPRYAGLPTLPSRADLEADIERALAHLADLDRRYDQQRGIIDGALHPQAWKDWRLIQLDERHRRERRPLIQFLCRSRQEIAARDLELVIGSERN
jgi:hypothetical protein